MSSAYRPSHTCKVVVLVLAFRRDIENKMASNLVLRPTSGLASLAFCFTSLNITEKYIPKRVGTRTQACFTLFTMEKGFDIIPSTWAVPCMFSWNDLIRSSKIGGHPNLCPPYFNGTFVFGTSVLNKHQPGNRGPCLLG